MKNKITKQQVEDPQLEVTQAISRVFGDLTVVAEISDTKIGFGFRLRCGNKVGHWQQRFESFATLTVDKRTFVLASGYWDGTFPIEQPFEIVNGLSRFEQQNF